MRRFRFKRSAWGRALLCTFAGINIILIPACIARAASSSTPEFYPIDLTAQANRQWSEFRPWINWNPPAGGLLPLDGVPFQINGVIQFRSITQRSPNDSLPTRARGIVVGRRFSRLHLFHFSEYSGEPGEPVVKFVLHGVDGKDDELLVRYEVHFQDWSHWPQAPGCSDPDTHPIWMAPPRYQPENPFVTLLWHTVFSNPRPEVEIASIEVRSLLSQVRYTLAGLTVETGPARASERFADSRPMRPVVEPSIVRFRLVDADDGSPVAHARVQASVINKGQSAVWDIVESDDHGDAILDFPSRGTPAQSEIVATGPNHFTSKFSLAIDAQRTNVFKMTRGKKIGGRIVDENDRPVRGAMVTVAGPQTDSAGQMYVSRWPDAITDTNGTWSLACAPPNFSRLVITIHHSKLLPAVIYEQDDSGYPFSVRGELLSEGKAVFRVKSGTELTGVIKSTAGAVTNAAVTLFCGDTPEGVRLMTRSGSKGGFRFTGLEPGPAALAVVTDGFAPKLQKLEITTNVVTLNLERGTTLEAKAQDESGQPLPQTLFQVTSWKGGAWFEHFGYSDALGMFRWPSAPSEPVNFTVFHPGFRVLREVSLSPATEPKTMVLDRQN